MRLSTAHLPSMDALQTACLDISQWAQEAGFSATAVAFAEACAAVVCDDDIWVAHARRDSSALVLAAWGAFIAARTNRIAGDEWRADVFYSRSIRFAAWAGQAAGRDSPDRKRAWSIYVRAHLGWGRLHSKHTRFKAASRHYRAAARRAFIEGEEWLSAQTCHDMLALAIEEGLMNSIGRQTVPDFEQARRRGRMALARYPRHHERFPAAVHDYVFTLVCEHRYAAAMPILELLMQAPIPQHDQVIGWGTLARTAGALGDAERYADAEAHVLRLAPHYELHAAASLVNLAYGARALGDWILAEQYVERALLLAKPAGLRLVLTVGHALLGEIHARNPGPPPADPAADKEADRLAVLAEALGDQLAGWRGPTWTKKESQFGPATLGAV